MIQQNHLVTIEIHHLKRILEAVLEIEGMVKYIRIPKGIVPTINSNIDEIKKIFQEEVKVR